MRGEPVMPAYYGTNHPPLLAPGLHICRSSIQPRATAAGRSPTDHQATSEYGISTTRFPNGTKEEFVVGADHAVWTNWTYTDGSWNGWVSMGGWVKSGIEIGYLRDDPYNFTIAAVGSDDNYWFRERYTDGSWSNWQVSCNVNPNGPGCP
ncbi:hypothetical protein [Streptomyces stackebrandtii]|uniref:hypothetical protein n=1 Tax=Streptomyces stackebrandtii TaxID=3051177 RepID=UPI0028DCE69A|nr:hypothetical protein [Streptomyces sp. DSM 40976]